MIQSWSPLALLTIVRNFKFTTADTLGEKLPFKGFVTNNLVLLMVMLFCVLWVLLFIVYYVEFKAFNRAGRQFDMK